MVTSGIRDPGAYAKLIENHPAARNEILALLHSTLGNGFVAAVLDADGKHKPDALKAADPGLVDEQSSTGSKIAATEKPAAPGTALSLDAEITAGRRAVELLGVVRQTLLPGYRRAVDALSIGPTMELATHIVSIVKSVQHAHNGLVDSTKHGAGSAMVTVPDGSMSDTSQAATARYADALALSGVLGLDVQTLEQELAIKLGPQVFRDRNVIGRAVAPPLGKDPSAYLANEAGATVELIATIVEIQDLTGANDKQCPILTEPQRQAVVARVEPWKGRPVNMAFLRAVLTDIGVWDEVAATKGAAGRTLAATANKSEAQGQITGALADVGEFDGEEAAQLLPDDPRQQVIDDIGNKSDDNAMTVFERIAGAAPNARGGLIRQLHGMGRLDRLCKHLPWKAVEDLSKIIAPFDLHAANLLEPYFADKGGGESLHKSYMGAVDSNLEQDTKLDTLQAFGWFLLDAAHNAFTAGFLHEYSAAYDARESGLITDNQFSSAATKALGKTAAVVAVSALTGGLAGEFVTGFAAPLVGKTAGSVIGAGVGGFTAGVTGHLTGDIYDQLLNGKEGFDSFGDYMKSGAVGGAMGLSTALLSTLSVQSASLVGEQATTRTADAYAKAAPEHMGLFEKVRAAGTKRGVQVKLKVRELADLIERNMGGPGGPGSLQLADGMDFRMLGPEAEVRVRLSADEIFNRPMEMSNGKGLTGDGKGAGGAPAAQGKDPAIRIESVDAEPVKTSPEEPVSTQGDEMSTSTSPELVDAPDASPATSPEAGRLRAKGLPETTIADVANKFGQRGIRAVDRLVAEGVPGTSATKSLAAAEKLGVADEVIDLVNSGKLRHSSTLRQLLEDAVHEGKQNIRGKVNELLEAKARADAGNEVSLGGSKFDPAKPESGQADVVQYGPEPEALQIKTITSESIEGVVDPLDKAVGQIKGEFGEIPPTGAKRIVRALIENEKNLLYRAGREQLIKAFRERMTRLVSGDGIEIQVRNGNGEIKIQSSEVFP